MALNYPYRAVNYQITTNDKRLVAVIGKRKKNVVARRDFQFEFLWNKLVADSFLSYFRTSMHVNRVYIMVICANTGALNKLDYDKA